MQKTFIFWQLSNDVYIYEYLGIFVENFKLIWYKVFYETLFWETDRLQIFT